MCGEIGAEWMEKWVGSVWRNEWGVCGEMGREWVEKWWRNSGEMGGEWVEKWVFSCVSHQIQEIYKFVNWVKFEICVRSGITIITI